MNPRAKQIAVFAGVGVVLFLALGWWIRGISAQDACLDRGGRWSAESGSCDEMSTPAPERGNVVAYDDPVDTVSGYEASCMFDTTHAHPDGRALLVEFLERDGRGDYSRTTGSTAQRIVRGPNQDRMRTPSSSSITPLIARSAIRSGWRP